MSVLLRAADLVKRPVVTLSGEDVAQIKDIIYSSATGELAGFTLNGRGLFSGPLRKTLPWENVHGLGPAAVMIRDETSLADRKALRGETEGAGGAVLGSSVITQSGRNLGMVTDVILSVGESLTDAVGYEIDPTDASAPRRQFVPLPDTLSVSGEALMVPDSATEFIRDDLAGFGAAVEEFRSRLRGRAAGTGEPGAPPIGDEPMDDKPMGDRPIDADSITAEPLVAPPPVAQPGVDGPPSPPPGSGPSVTRVLPAVDPDGHSEEPWGRPVDPSAADPADRPATRELPTDDTSTGEYR